MGTVSYQPNIVYNPMYTLYQREYANDWPLPQENSWSNFAQRVGLMALPFISLHRPFRYPLALFTGSLRIWTTSDQLYRSEQKFSFEAAYKLFHAALAIGALAAAVFGHPIAMIVITAQDLLIEFAYFYRCLSENKTDEIFQSIPRIISQITYLALVSFGGMELSLFALAFQVIVLFMSAIHKSKKGDWLGYLEGGADLLMAGIRFGQLRTQQTRYARQLEIDAAIKKAFVGKLGAKWQFPSDHLPVGVEVNGVKIISWNVLNNAHMAWVKERDSQGLLGSMITDLDHPVQEDGLTCRDLKVIEMVQDMAQRGHIIALQECGEPFLKGLQERLPESWQMVKSFEMPQTDQDVVLFNREVLSFQSELSETSTKAYQSAVGRPIQNVMFETMNDGKSLSIVNGHIPGDPTRPAVREEFVRYAAERHPKGGTTIALGDNNFERHEMMASAFKAGVDGFSMHSPWNTNIDPVTKESKSIDHLLVIGEGHASRDLTPSEVLQHGNLEETISLLETPFMPRWRSPVSKT